MPVGDKRKHLQFDKELPYSLLHEDDKHQPYFCYEETKSETKTAVAKAYAQVFQNDIQEPLKYSAIS